MGRGRLGFRVFPCSILLLHQALAAAPGELPETEEPPSPRLGYAQKKGSLGKRRWAEATEAEVAERDRWEECDACGRWVNLGRPAEHGGELAAPCPGCGVQVGSFILYLQPRKGNGPFGPAQCQLAVSSRGCGVKDCISLQLPYPLRFAAS